MVIHGIVAWLDAYGIGGEPSCSRACFDGPHGATQQFLRMTAVQLHMSEAAC